MIVTPLGPIKLYVNEKEIKYRAVHYILDDRCRDLNGRYLIHYEYKKEYKKQKIKCCLPSFVTEGDIESDERLEAISFYDHFTKVTIGIEASFGMDEEYGYDYSGSYLSNGIEYETNSKTKSQTLLFAVSWIRPYTEENDHQTTTGADPYSMNSKIVNKFRQVDERAMLMWHDILLILNVELEERFSSFRSIALNYFESPVKFMISTLPEESHKHDEILKVTNRIIENNMLSDIENRLMTYKIVLEEYRSR